MSLHQAVEAMIKEAMERGEFSDLPGKGKPLDMDAWFETPEELRMAYSMLKNAGLVPEELTLLQEIAVLKKQLAAETEDSRRKSLQKSIGDRQLRYDLLLEKRKRQVRGL